MVKRVVLAVFIAFSWGRSSGQDISGKGDGRSYHVIGLRIGFNQLKEENLHPLVNSGLITAASYEYRGQKLRYSHFRFGMGLSRLKAGPEDYNSTFYIEIKADASHCFRYLEKSRLIGFLGPQVGVSYSAAFFPDWDDSHLYWANSYYLGMNSVFMVDFESDRELFASLSLPVLSFYSRPDQERLYKIDDTSVGGILSDLNSNLEPGFWNRSIFIDLNLEYQFPVFDTRREAVYYNLDFSRMRRSKGRAYIHLGHQIGLKILL